VPLATAAHVSTGADIEMPLPASFAARTAAGCDGTTVSCALETNGREIRNRNNNLIKRRKYIRRHLYAKYLSAD
jgi:hypothetical protein